MLTPETRLEHWLEEIRDAFAEKVTIEPLSVDDNGTYTAPSGTAYSPVTVNVPTGGGGEYTVESYEDLTFAVGDDIQSCILELPQLTLKDCAYLVNQDDDTDIYGFAYESAGSGGSSSRHSFNFMRIRTVQPPGSMSLTKANATATTYSAVGTQLQEKTFTLYIARHV